MLTMKNEFAKATVIVTLKDEDENTVSGSDHSDDVFPTVQSQVKNFIKNYSYQICDNQSELRSVLKISFHSDLQHISFSRIFQLHHTSSASSILYGHVRIRTCNLFFCFSFIFIFKRHYGRSLRQRITLYTLFVFHWHFTNSSKFHCYLRIVYSRQKEFFVRWEAGYIQGDPRTTQPYFQTRGKK